MKPDSPNRTTGTDMSPAIFGRITALAYDEAGLTIPISKKALVQSRISRRLRVLRLPDFESYVALIDSDEGRDERQEMISALTTNVSHFFREAQHFEILTRKVFPCLLDKARKSGRVRIWSAGCSSGQEPYSIAMSLLDMESRAGDLDIRILASDIDRAILQTAKSAHYTAEQVSGIPQQLKQKYLVPSNGGFDVTEPVRRIVSFRELNLHSPWPMKGIFDVIFCRNVVIYFDEATQKKLWPRFASQLAPEGWLFMGHSERVQDPVQYQLQPAGVTCYRKIPAKPPLSASGSTHVTA